MFAAAESAVRWHRIGAAAAGGCAVMNAGGAVVDWAPAPMNTAGGAIGGAGGRGGLRARRDEHRGRRRSSAERAVADWAPGAMKRRGRRHLERGRSRGGLAPGRDVQRGISPARVGQRRNAMGGAATRRRLRLCADFF